TPTTLYAGTESTTKDPGGIFKSTNGGAIWSRVYPIHSGYVTGLIVDPLTPTTLYMSWYLSENPDSFSRGVYKSTDGGASWFGVKTGLEKIQVWVLAMDPVTPTNVYGRTDIGVFKSTIGGGNWTPINSGLTNTNIGPLAVDPLMPATIYTGTGGGGVFALTQT